MSVLVKGMEMPLNCATCYRDGTHYHVHMLAGCPFLRESIHSHDFRKERHPNCPLTELPPHGRLGDLDRLERMFADIDNAPYSGFDGEEPFYSADDAAQIIRLSPTIIPAEEDEP